METVRSADGTSLAYERTGEGPALVLVAAAFCTRDALRGLAAELAPQFTVYVYDRRGRGDSGDAAAGGPADAYLEVEDLAAVLGAAGGTPRVYGQSSGACVALEGAAAGLPVGRLAVYEPPYVIPGTRPLPAGLEERLRTLLAAGERAAAVRLFQREAELLPEAELTALESSARWPELQTLAHTLPYDAAACNDSRIPHTRLARIRVPALVLGRRAGPPWLRASIGALAEAVPGARADLLEGWGRGAPSDRLAPVLKEFFG